MSYKNCVVVLSGGQDSVTCLGVALKEYPTGNVYAVGFDYGQRHSVELQQAKLICEQLDVTFRVMPIPALAELNDSGLTNNETDLTTKHHRNSDLPASFVPNRNALFLTIAHAYAQTVNANVLYTGVCETDYSGYPDCRAVFVNELETALNTGYMTSIEIKTPLMHLDKADTFRLAELNNVLDIVINLSHTCYNGDREHQHKWGYGCDNCPACALRKKGFEEYLDRWVR